MKVLFIASELTPIAKVGGLGDVTGALPLALKKLGADIRVALPKYGLIDDKKYPSKLIVKNIEIQRGREIDLINLYSTSIPKSEVPLYLIENKKFFGSKNIYQDNTAFVSGLDEIQKFLFFSKAVLQIFKPLKWQPEIIHCNDWHTAIIPLLIKLSSLKIKTLFTIHNLANQGVWNVQEIYNFLGLEENFHSNLKKRDKRNDFNLMQQGILNTDLINTVSPTYAKEILTHQYGCLLEKNLQEREKDLFGIINGIDTHYFNPKIDPEIKFNYSLKNLENKIKNKIELQKELNLPTNPKTPLLGVVSRLTSQKGMKLIIEIIPDLVKLNCQLVILGMGKKDYENGFVENAKKYPKNISSQIKFDASLAQRIYAGSDMFLMPSQFEPCGLGQLIAMRYGTIPIVRATGGLKDTVNKETGFIFEKYDSQEFLATIKKALEIYQNEKIWRQIQIKGVKQDFSWLKSAKEYLKLYKKLKS